MKKSILIVLVAMSVIFFNKTAHASPCETQNNTSEIIECVNLRYEEADEELKAFWQELSIRIRNELKGSQGNWRKYREDFCTTQANEIAGKGKMWSIIFLSCKTIETKKRIEYLEEF